MKSGRAGNVPSMTSTREFTPTEQIPYIVESLRESFEAGKTLPLSKRKEQLDRLYKQIVHDHDYLCLALEKDLHRPASETQLLELTGVLGEIQTAIRSLSDWAKPSGLPFDLKVSVASPQLTKEPLGTVLVIGPWNYPYLCFIAPIVSAIAAGNTVIGKPGEMSPHAACAAMQTLEKALDPEIFQSVYGGASETTELLKQHYDKICFTGSSRVGKIVSQAAAANLTPVILELGGKSPVFISKSCDVKLAAKRIAWGKFVNAGQTCIAPDYVLIEESVRDRFIEEMKKVINSFYPNINKDTYDFAHIVNDPLWVRAAELVRSTEGTVIQFGTGDRESRFFPPTIVTDVTIEDILMEDELFAPILPVISVKSIRLPDVRPFIRKHDTPLALYIFSDNQKEIDSLRVIRAGAILVNDTLMQCASPHIKFGGVGQSGTGSYHGKSGFDNFTHRRPYMVQPKIVEPSISYRYPPYNEIKKSIIADGEKATYMPLIKGTFSTLFRS